jgi:deoxycytidylate deaminase
VKSWDRGFQVAKAASEYGVAPRKSRKVGAAIYAGSKLLAIGFNHYHKTHPATEWGIHAEHAALIKRAYYPAKNMVIYVYRELANGSVACSRPCDNCIYLMRLAGVSTVRFADADGIFKEEKI